MALVSVPRGESPTKATLWAIMSSLPQPLVAVPSFYFVQLFSFLLPWAPSLPSPAFSTTSFSPHILQRLSTVFILQRLSTVFSVPTQHCEELCSPGTTRRA